MRAIPLTPSQTDGAGGGGGGTIGGTIAVNQIAYGTALNTIGGSANLTYTGGLFQLIGAAIFKGDGFVWGQQSSTAINYNVLLTDFLVRVVPVPPATITITLPSVITSTVGQVFIIKDGNGFASIGTPLIISARAAETVDGALTQSFIAPYVSVTVRNTGATWDII